LLKRNHWENAVTARRWTSRLGTPVDTWVGGRIAARRQALGLSQTMLAERVGVSFQQIQKYETGVNRISASRLHQIAMALGVDAGSFFPLGGPTTPVNAVSPDSGRVTPGLRLAHAFSRIRRPRTRNALVVLAEALAGSTDTPG
jgi:DNA-binding transcriptional regulator YiaG